MGAQIPPRPVRFGTAELSADPFRPTTWTVTVDGVPQSHVDLADPAHLRAPYMRWIAAVVDRHWPAGSAVDAVHVGGGALTMPRYLAETRPGSAQTVFELDGELVDYVREHLLPDGVPGAYVEVCDGRSGVEALPDRCADLVVLDAFRGGDVATDLAGVEFLREIARVLRPGGLYLANLWDIEFTLRAVASVDAVFPHVAALAEAGVLLKERAGNLVVAASSRELPDLIAWAASARPQVYCLSPAHLTTVCGAAAPLTDADPLAGPVRTVRPGWGFS